ncbi:PREDICTED: acetyl-coenzyme A synthetase, cytoplasmic-like [Branchiostoma belcheri]|uniref:Acetyl-coenzyme A synthetase n=1 Tax=Branchiostoma belcheri TaxID=7741 RepID=A0A6P4YK30_BRABE|nr:PREDICTED: acetyl-coenzyme A synthetase, cytoplasmic-like [Branchiostoma belcheri]
MADKGEGVYVPPDHIRENSHVSSIEQYHKMYKESVENPEAFWGKIAHDFYWKTQCTGKFWEYNYDVRQGDIFIKWMEGATTNVCYNCLDHNIDKGLGDSVAFYWEGNYPGDASQITYNQLLKEVCKCANVLINKGVKKGDRVAIYMPMIVELVVAMLACARIGAVHSIVFGGFSADSLAGRILDSKSSVLITADGVYRGEKLLNLKEISDTAIQECLEAGFTVSSCIVVRHLGESREPGAGGDTEHHPPKRPCIKLQTNWHNDRDCWWHDLMADASDQFEPVWLDAEDPLFMLYTSGSTGKPKGVLHTQAGYMLYAATTTKYVFDYKPGEVYWCTADIGWITGHSYITYGPMLNGATSVIFEGMPIWPDAGRMWEIVDKYKVSKFYTAPTAIRTLMKFGEDYVKKHSRKSLKVLGTVGEPINPEAWLWYYNVIGDKRCCIVDTYWQTETGGHVLTPLPGATPAKPGSATLPFFGQVPAVVNENGEELDGPCEGYLVLKQPWPGQMRTVYGDHQRFERTYFQKFPGYYCTGDGCTRDKDGYYWITGRTDDMMNVSGHLLSTAEIESALIEHSAVAEAAVVAYPHSIKGECVYCFVTLKEGKMFNDALVGELKVKVRQKIGPIAVPEYIQNAPGLPKTRSGKIMRRVLRKIAKNQQDLGDVSTMADSSVVEVLFQNRPKNVQGWVE